MVPITSSLKSSTVACTAASVVLGIQVVNQIASRFFIGTNSNFRFSLHGLCVLSILRIAPDSPIGILSFMTALNIAALCIGAIRDKQQRASSTPDFLEDMSEIVNQDDILTANESRVNELQCALKNSKKPNVVLVGLPGVGKSALVKHVVALMKMNQIPNDSPLFGKRIFSLDHNSFLSQTKYLGEINVRIQKLLRFCEQNPDVYIFIDELHIVLDSGKSSNNKNSFASYLKVPISEGKIRIIGASTRREYKKCTKKDQAFERRFQNITIREPTTEECLQMLHHYSKSSSFERDYPSVKFTQEALVAIIEKTNTIRPDLGQPDKALTALADIAGRCEGEISKEKIESLLNEYLERNPNLTRRAILSDYV